MPSTASSIPTTKEVPPSSSPDIKGDLDKIGTEHAEFPEGGTAAWCTVIGGALIMFCGYGYTSSFGVYQDFYTRHYLTNESASAISWIGGINTFLASTLGLVAGALYDRGYFYHLMIGGSLLQSFSMFMLSLAQPGHYYQIALAQGISLGITQGMVYVPTVAVISQYFYRRRTLAMSLVASGSSLGSIVHPIMLNNLFRSLGFANSVRISAAFVSALVLIACLLMRTRMGPSPSSANYLSIGKGILHDVPYCVICVGLLCAAIGLCFPLFYLQLDSVQHGNSTTFSFYSLVLFNGGSFIGRLSAGFIAPRVGVLRSVTITSTICGILLLGMIDLSSVPTVVVLGTSYGYFSGGFIALWAPLMAHFTNDLSELGARMGICASLLSLGALIGGPVSGALLTSQYKWWRPSLFSGLITLFGCLLLGMMEIVLMRRKRSTEKETP